MRHRATRPFYDVWRPLLRASARPLGLLTRLGAVRAVLALAVTLCVGAGAFAAVSAFTGGSTGRPAATADVGQRGTLTSSRSGDRQQLDPASPSTGKGAGADRSSAAPTHVPRPRGAGAGLARTTAPVTRALRSEVGQATGAPSIGASTSPAVPSTPSGSASASNSPSGQSSQGSASASPNSSGERSAPDTQLTDQFPDGDVAVFTFTASEVSTFTCSLDGAAYSSCVSPLTFARVGPGWHTFSVRARDAAGNVDPTPASVRWHASGGPVNVQ